MKNVYTSLLQNTTSFLPWRLQKRLFSGKSKWLEIICDYGQKSLFKLYYHVNLTHLQSYLLIQLCKNMFIKFLLLIDLGVQFYSSSHLIP